MKQSPCVGDILLENEAQITVLNKKKLGSGATCEVYLCEYKNTKAAYKKMTKIESHSYFPKQLFREIAITQQCEHPATLKILAFDIRPSKNFSEIKAMILNEYYPKKTLDDCLKEMSSSWTPTDRTICMYGLARGIKHLHTTWKIIHRDIKSSNVFIDEHKRPHIADFGFSKENKNLDQSRACGTPYYMAPEVLTQKFSFPVDIFSLSIVFFEILEGKKCRMKTPNQFQGFKLQKFLNNEWKQGKRPAFTQTKAELKELIDHMWCYEAEERLKIEDICYKLENPDYWIDGTDKNEFLQYKKMIDDYEKDFIGNRVGLDTQEMIQYFNNEVDDDEFSGFSDDLDIDDDDQNDSNHNNLKDNDFLFVRKLIKLANKYNSEAMISLGILFKEGVIVPKDLVLSLKYLNQSLSFGNVYAEILINEINNIPNQNSVCEKEKHFIIGQIHESKGEITDALTSYLFSAKLGHAEAPGRIGSILLRQTDHFELGEKYLLKGAEKNNLFSMYWLAMYYLSHQNYQQSISLLKKCLQQNHFEAASALGRAYLELKDLEMAKKYFRESFKVYHDESAIKFIKFINLELSDDKGENEDFD
ncbi:hypothetical protein TRFO_11404 [Tritrichomonas foetus]|uniref:Protein kinase domain-containing protein n=1 Tax=Tritrichomonas foetus TaxID=1144522 RepID=A0A1J4J9K9_9EUKA|nr:hypothetical protein TRFO_11404 [Tritrichomonas foetus]|eukprot:OHS94117.1 hypothetical protein TRFO_11404 [Tritrichomonas foetus]